MKSLITIGVSTALLAGCIEVVGPQGPPGNANVYTVNVTFSPAGAVVNGAVVSQGYQVPGITPSVVDHGAVLVYFRDQRTWTALPFTIGIESSEVEAVDYTFSIGYAYDDGFLEVFIEASTPDEVVWSEIVSLLPENYLMKVVVIDGYTAIRESGVNPRDFHAVSAFFGIEDH